MKEKKENLTVVKIGGNVINDEQLLFQVLQDFCQLEGKKILIHGGGKKASALMQKMGITPRLIDGRRITDDAALEIVIMVYAGLINKSLVSRLQSMGCNALGMSGADLNAIKAHKRLVKEIDYGWVGDIEEVNDQHIAQLLETDFIPVFCAITHDNNGQLLNTNADSIASRVAAAMGKRYDTTLILCFEKDGILSDPEDDNSIIDSIDHSLYKELVKSGVISAGMLPKTESAFFALQHGAGKVYIAGPQALRTTPVKGTLLS